MPVPAIYGGSANDIRSGQCEEPAAGLTVTFTGGLETPPTVATSGCTPVATDVGSVKVTCVTPN